MGSTEDYEKGQDRLDGILIELSVVSVLDTHESG